MLSSSMLPMPATWGDLLGELASVFLRRSTHKLFVLLASGMILAGRRTVVAMAAAAGIADQFRRALVTDNLDIGRPDTIEIIFNRRIRADTASEFKTNIVSRGTEVTVNAFYKHSRIKQYHHKDQRALRIETVINACQLTWAASAAWSTWTNWRPKRVHSTPG